MIERTLVAALVIGVIGFGTFVWLLEQGVSEADVRNHQRLLIVRFQTIDIGDA